MAKVTISQWTEKAKGRMDTLVKKVAIDAFSEVILKSPVDTGRFRGNWQVAIGSVPDGILLVDDPTGQVTISKVTAVAQGVKAGQVITLVNNLPYAQRLEYGWSNQAPGGMVRLTAQRWQAIVDKALTQIVRST
ncbi:hypothetical protein AN189_17625 [Loktanella sp. 3ANDIMAR09]|uniref:HK97 gp10 family phage protein n=1 Tax=Loktanella sp. 3ANDIMAR09 TaxID=1225657 RepID=UPI0006FC5BD1|nr:HK97 gp10 family phage protein [Loktanella sp. 3ANDIMAR09]KQI67043.1 hypothetical protein AN189_17625 [Loktanella sp. 3ANDIMAR09]